MLASAELPKKVVLEDVACPLGCARDEEPLRHGTDRISGVGGTFQTVRCRSCGLIRTNPRPTRETMATYYPDVYAPYHYTKATVTPRPQRSFLSRWARRVVEFNSDRLPAMTPGHALEIGCASGAFIAYLAAQGWTAEGVELNANAAAAARDRGFRVQNCAVEEMTPPRQPADAVIAWMVLEHLHDPLGALERFRDWTTPHAWLVASVPNAHTFGARAFGAEWYPLQLPCHLFHYDAPTLKALLARAGWRLERVLYQRVVGDFVASLGNFAETIGSAAWADRLRHVAKKRNFHLAMYPLATALAAFGQTGRMTIWATRA